jgi:hypothetical protein
MRRDSAPTMVTSRTSQRPESAGVCTCIRALRTTVAAISRGLSKEISTNVRAFEQQACSPCRMTRTVAPCDMQAAGKHHESPDAPVQCNRTVTDAEAFIPCLTRHGHTRGECQVLCLPSDAAEVIICRLEWRSGTRTASAHRRLTRQPGTVAAEGGSSDHSTTSPDVHSDRQPEAVPRRSSVSVDHT